MGMFNISRFDISDSYAILGFTKEEQMRKILLTILILVVFSAVAGYIFLRSYIPDYDMNLVTPEL